jgi:hypothetical protein
MSILWRKNISDNQENVRIRHPRISFRKAGIAINGLLKISNRFAVAVTCELVGKVSSTQISLISQRRGSVGAKRRGCKPD